MLNIYHLKINENFCIVHETLKLFQCADCFNMRGYTLLHLDGSLTRELGQFRLQHLKKKYILYGLLEETTIHLSEGGQDAFS